MGLFLLQNAGADMYLGQSLLQFAIKISLERVLCDHKFAVGR